MITIIIVIVDTIQRARVISPADSWNLDEDAHVHTSGERQRCQHCRHLAAFRWPTICSTASRHIQHSFGRLFSFIHFFCVRYCNGSEHKSKNTIQNMLNGMELRCIISRSCCMYQKDQTKNSVVINPWARAILWCSTYIRACDRVCCSLFGAHSIVESTPVATHTHSQAISVWMVEVESSDIPTSSTFNKGARWKKSIYIYVYCVTIV